MTASRRVKPAHMLLVHVDPRTRAVDMVEEEPLSREKDGNLFVEDKLANALVESVFAAHLIWIGSGFPDYPLYGGAQHPFYGCTQTGWSTLTRSSAVKFLTERIKHQIDDVIEDDRLRAAGELAYPDDGPDTDDEPEDDVISFGEFDTQFEACIGYDDGVRALHAPCVWLAS